MLKCVTFADIEKITRKKEKITQKKNPMIEILLYQNSTIILLFGHCMPSSLPIIQLLPATLIAVLLGSTVVSPYVGMARKQNGGYNASISVQTLIFHLVVNSTRLKTVRSALWRCPNTTVALRLLVNVVKVTNLEVVKIEFRHLPVLLSSSFFLSSSPPASLAP